MIARLVLMLSFLLASCSSDEREAREEQPQREDEARGPRGAPAARCAGASQDPPELDTIYARASVDLARAITEMEALVGGHAGSATARVRLGELLLRTQPPAAERAQGWLERGLALSDRGCTLASRDEWIALQSMAQSHMMQNDYEGAIAPLSRSLRRWPSVRMTRYNLACALCRTGDLDGCARELGRALHDAEETPRFLQDTRRPDGYYDELARGDPDLAALRNDAARFERVLNPR